MTSWDIYVERLDARGGTRRNVVLKREQRFLNSKLPSSLSYHAAIVNNIERELAIINSDDFSKKTVCSLPGDDLPHGGLVDWMNAHWLITQKDINNEVYTKCTMERCNYLLKWVNPGGAIIERWCIIEDGTKYLTGEYGDRNYVIVRGDSRISMILPRDEETILLNRENRFIIDDYDTPDPLAYRLTKPFKLGNNYDGDGIVSYVLTECNTEDSDNLELHIANYYDFFPRSDDDRWEEDHLPLPTPPEVQTGRKEWI